MLTWMQHTIELVYHVTRWNLNSLFSHLRWCGLLHVAFPGDVGMHAPTFNKWHMKKNKKGILHILTHGAKRGCGSASLVVCIDDKIHDIRKRNVTIKSQI